MASPLYVQERYLEALRCGDSKAYEQLYKECRPMILNFIRKNSGQDEEGLDLLQEALIVLFTNLEEPQFRLSCSIKTYIYSICRRKWLYHLRQQKDIVDIHEFVEIISDETNQTTYPITGQQLEQAIGILDATCRDLLTRFYFLEQSLEEIADAMQLMNANTAKTRRFRCMRNLIDIVKKLINHE